MNLEVTTQEAQLILNALGELPAKVSMGLIAKVKVQAEAELNKQKVEEQGGE